MQSLFGLLVTTLLGVTLIAFGCAEAKPVARTVNDAARVACEVMYGADAEKAGLSLKDLCAMDAVIHPIVDQLLAAQAAKAGVPAPKSKE